jgi:hypothetical protein
MADFSQLQRAQKELQEQQHSLHLQQDEIQEQLDSIEETLISLDRLLDTYSRLSGTSSSTNFKSRRSRTSTSPIVLAILEILDGNPDDIFHTGFISKRLQALNIINSANSGAITSGTLRRMADRGQIRKIRIGQFQSIHGG